MSVSIAIDSGSDTIDSRDVIERIEEMKGEREALEEAVTEAREALAAVKRPKKALKVALVEAAIALDEWDADNGDELKSLRELNDEGDKASGEWEDGATLINEDYWDDYCMGLVQDIGDLPRDLPDYLVIDWTATAANLSQDYTQIEWDGNTFYVR